jgi:O-antigen ligase
VYLHILAAKSGLLSFYIFLTGYGLYLSVIKKKWAGIIVILAIPLFLVLAVEYMPTFKERKNYMSYTYYMLEHGDKSGTEGDINRLMSYDVAFRLIGQHPLFGVGTGDMLTEMKRGYDKWYPGVEEQEKLLPHNQFLVVALGCGIPAMLLFTIWAFMPLGLLRRNRQSFFFFIVWLILLLQLLIEPVLEVQFGVFIYVFFILLQRHELPGLHPGNNAAAIPS